MSVKSIALALQGGGSHTAFTWGVLDRLLDEVAAGGLRFNAISGTSGGAINGAVCVYGLRTGPAEAKRLLKALWDGISAQSLWPPDPTRFFLPEYSAAHWNVDWTPFAIGLGMAEQIWSPYYGFAFKNPLDALIRNLIADFAALNSDDGAAPKLFVCATEVNSTARRIFKQPEITPEALLAAACCPTLFQAVPIDGVFYWDGGYAGNPALNPLVDCADDLLTVTVNPLNREGPPPKTPRQIINRINEVSFNASWIMEMRQILLINQLLARGLLQGGPYKPKRFHLIRDEKFMEEIGAASKQNPSRDFVYELFERGRKAADRWVENDLAKVGMASSFEAEKEIALRLEGSATARAQLRPPAVPTSSGATAVNERHVAAVVAPKAPERGRSKVARSDAAASAPAPRGRAPAAARGD